jgi:hypothetical protein
MMNRHNPVEASSAKNKDIYCIAYICNAISLDVDKSETLERFAVKIHLDLRGRRKNRKICSF